MAIVYTYAQENRGRKVGFFFITIDVKYLPGATFLVTFIGTSPRAAMYQAVGFVAAHLYNQLTVYWPRYGGGRNLFPTPKFVQNWFAGGQRVVKTRQGTIYRPASATTTGISSGWGARGQGRRLGD